MAKLGSTKNPLVLRVSDESEIDRIAWICGENDWHFILAFDPDEEQDLSDLEKKLNPPTRSETMKIGRNAPCPCGSGQKFKKCCAVST